ncbi:MAG: hypothetical protein WC966_07600 [Bradymonadales bacterium]|jgi:hypothetical protein
MRMRFGRIIAALGFGALLSVSLPSAMVFAQDGVKVREDVRNNQKRLDSLRADSSGRYVAEMTAISNWIEEALVRVGKNEISAARSLNIKTVVYLDYVDASLKKDTAVQMAGALELEANAVKAEKGKLEAAVQTLLAEEKLLQEQLKGQK